MTVLMPRRISEAAPGVATPAASARAARRRRADCARAEGEADLEDGSRRVTHGQAERAAQYCWRMAAVFLAPVILLFIAAPTVFARLETTKLILVGAASGMRCLPSPPPWCSLCFCLWRNGERLTGIR